MPPPGTVVRVLAGDLLKEAGLIPVEALAPGDRPTPTPTSVPTATPTPRPVPTPDPNHPPQTGTFTVICNEVHSLSTCATPYGRLVGPYLNLAFTESSVGKTLTVTVNQASCRPDRPPDRCLSPTPYLYRSLAGEVGSSTWLLPLECINDGRFGPPNAILVGVLHPTRPWKIEYGQYFIHFAVQPGAGMWPLGDAPESITYTIAITD